MKNFLIAALVVISSGLAFYFSFYFAQIWFFAWLAPIPALLYAYRASVGNTFIVAFLASLGAGLNQIIGYWPTIIPTQAFITSALVQSLEWSIIILITQILVKQIKNPLSIFAYPTCFALLEWLQSLSQQGTFTH